MPLTRTEFQQVRQAIWSVNDNVQIGTPPAGKNDGLVMKIFSDTPIDEVQRALILEAVTERLGYAISAGDISYHLGKKVGDETKIAAGKVAGSATATMGR